MPDICSAGACGIPHLVLPRHFTLKAKSQNSVTVLSSIMNLKMAEVIIAI